MEKGFDISALDRLEQGAEGEPQQQRKAKFAPKLGVRQPAPAAPETGCR
jgi:hypothetical protein